MNKNIVKNLTPFLFLFILLGILWRSLGTSHATMQTGSLIGQSLPPFKIQDLRSPDRSFSQNTLRGHVSLLNFWASWCDACKMEHAMMMKIANQYHIPIYGIAYKDSISTIKSWLNDHGNPFTFVGNDPSGDIAVDYGIYGTPETFIVNPNGKIVYRHIGVIDESVWENNMYPIIKKYQSGM